MYINQAVTAQIFSVSELASLIRESLEIGFAPLWLSGEISGLTYASSGHVYFTLKDSHAQMRCTFWRSKAQTLGWRLENGQQIEAHVSPTLYEARGDFQLNVDNLRRAGAGNLFEQFLLLKARLEAEGLFKQEDKRPLPPFPRVIGVVTSPQAAAWHDVQTACQRRAPHIRLILSQTPVQGPAAVPGVVSALRNISHSDAELVILCRGGGSLEDLWAFNDEAIARAIRACPVPVISGIGHETDFTIADFAADLRAPTPTAAAELASPSRESLLHSLNGLERRLQRSGTAYLMRQAQRVDQLGIRLLHPKARLSNLKERLQSFHRRLELAAVRHIEVHSQHLQHLARSLHHLNPTAILERGFSLVRCQPAGRIVSDASTLNGGDHLTIQFARGLAEVTVLNCEDR